MKVFGKKLMNPVKVDVINKCETRRAAIGGAIGTVVEPGFGTVVGAGIGAATCDGGVVKNVKAALTPSNWIRKSNGY